ncbi:MAG: tetratricopeptide repeat protein [Planctomycetota bacterium]|jgi:TolA-binding protein
MVRGNGFVTLVLCGLILFGLAITCFADAEAQLDLAGQYKNDRHYDQAEPIYKQIVADFPGTADAMRAQGLLAAMYVLWGKQPQADTAYRQLHASFSEHRELPKALYAIAKAYERRQKYERAAGLYQQVAQRSSEGELAGKAQLHAAKVNVLALIASGQESEVVQAEISKLITEFDDGSLADAEEFPETLYDIARECQGVEKYDQTRNLYQQIVQQYPQSRYAKRARFDIEALNVFALGDTASDADVNAVVDSFAAKFTDDPYLPTAVYKMAVEYHMKAYGLVNKDLTEQAEGCFQKAALVFERVANEYPSADVVPKALRSAGDCYRKLGRYAESTRRYQKVLDDFPDFETAWNALFQIGRNYEDLKKSGAISKSEADLKIEAAYEQILEKHPSCPGARHARRWLSRRNSK